MSNTRVPYDQRRFTVFSQERARCVPAGRYDDLDDAIRHTETVTYNMYVFDRERWEVVYRNWDSPVNKED